MHFCRRVFLTPKAFNRGQFMNGQPGRQQCGYLSVGSSSFIACQRSRKNKGSVVAVVVRGSMQWLHAENTVVVELIVRFGLYYVHILLDVDLEVSFMHWANCICCKLHTVIVHPSDRLHSLTSWSRLVHRIWWKWSTCGTCTSLFPVVSAHSVICSQCSNSLACRRASSFSLR